MLLKQKPWCCNHQNPILQPRTLNITTSSPRHLHAQPPTAATAARVPLAMLNAQLLPLQRVCPSQCSTPNCCRCSACAGAAARVPQLLPLQRVCWRCSACAPTAAAAARVLALQRVCPSQHSFMSHAPPPPQVRSSLLLEVRLLRDTLRDAQVCHP